MKKSFLFIFLFLFANVYSDFIEEHNWNIVKSVRPYSYTAEFVIKKGDVTLGKVVRTGLFTPRYYYDLYDANNVLQVRGITRAFSLGFFFPLAMQIDLYAGDYLIGMIQGQIFTNSRAKFNFYDAQGELVTSAYLNDESSDFIIVSAQNEAKVIAELNGKVFGDASVWEMNPKSYPLLMDEQALLVFAGFISDYQKSFIRPPKEVHHHHYDH